MGIVTLRAGTGSAYALPAGGAIRISNPSGTQVVDCFAVNPAEPAEFLSMEHTRTALSRISPRVGDPLVSTRRRPMLRLVEDTSPGVHDTLIAACDPERYRQLGVVGYHPSCAENLGTALAEIGIDPLPVVPSPLNLFMRIPWDLDGRLEFLPTSTRPGDCVTLRAEREVVVVLSACPMDVNPINSGAPADIEVELLDA